MPRVVSPRTVSVESPLSAPCAALEGPKAATRWGNEPRDPPRSAERGRQHLAELGVGEGDRVTPHAARGAGVLDDVLEVLAPHAEGPHGFPEPFDTVPDGRLRTAGEQPRGLGVSNECATAGVALP